MSTMTSLSVLLSLFGLVVIAWAQPRLDPDEPISRLQGRVYIKNTKINRYLVFDPSSTEAEPKPIIWNVPHVIPPRGGAWWYLLKSPNVHEVDYNLVGGAEWNYTLCVSMLQPDGEKYYHHLHGFIDNFHLEVPECRWRIPLTFDKRNFWIINRMYGGHMLAPEYKFNIDPLRKPVFQSVRVEGKTDREVWEIGRVSEPNDKVSEDED